MSDPGPVLVQVVRSGVVESVHTGHLVVLGPTGEILLERGDPARPFFWRSSAKPLQATAILAAGTPLTSPQLALAAASHSAEPVHVDVVTSSLDAGDLGEGDLECPPDWPLDETARAVARVAGDGPRRIWMNCSGKHAAMLRAAQTNGWPSAGYSHRAHPLQQLVRATVEEIAGERIDVTGVDGCGLPLFGLSLRALARSFRELRGGPVATAMREHPHLVGGTGRLATELLTAVPGLLAKDGAEGVFAAALPDGSAAAVKIDDGAGRAVDVVARSVLGLLGAGGLTTSEPVLGGGRAVGEVRLAPGVLPGV